MESNEKLSGILDLEKDIYVQEKLLNGLKKRFDTLNADTKGLEPPKTEVEFTRGFQRWVPGIGLLFLAFYQYNKHGQWSTWIAAGLALLGVLSLIYNFAKREKIKLSSTIAKENKAKIDEFNQRVREWQARMEKLRPKLIALQSEIDKTDKSLTKNYEALIEAYEDAGLSREDRGIEALCTALGIDGVSEIFAQLDEACEEKISGILERCGLVSEE